MAELRKITTSYDQTEDRLRLAGEDGHGQVLILWLTLRLANRLVDALVRWLAEEGLDNEVGQAWRQDEALLQWQGGEPVLPEAETPGWLVEVIDLGRKPGHYTLTFRGLDEERAVLSLTGQELRQWLSIVHGLYQQAEWPCHLWPAWICQASPARVAAAVH